MLTILEGFFAHVAHLQAPVQAALVAASGAAIGWFVNDRLGRNNEKSRRQVEAQLRFVERQIEELYGPLAANLYEGRQAFSDLLLSLGRTYVFNGDDLLPPEELQTWLFWTETEFLPRNEQIKTLLKTKAHLVDGATFPNSYVVFLDHCNSWAVNHRRWKMQGTEYSWHSRINWSTEFENEAITTFQVLKARHFELLGRLGDGKHKR